MAATQKLSPDQIKSENIFDMDGGMMTIINLLCHYDFETVVDIGSGQGEHARLLRYFGKKIYTIDMDKDADYVGDFLDVEIDRKFDVVWCSHVLEHQRNIGLFLEKIYDDCLDDDNILAITVPTHPRTTLIGGHLTNWNAGLLVGNLVYAGFDCSKAQLIQTNDLGLIVRKKEAVGSEIRANSVITNCRYDEDKNSDDSFSYIQKYYPFPVKQGANAEIPAAHWPTNFKFPFADHHEPIMIKSKLTPNGLIITPDDPSITLNIQK